MKEIDDWIIKRNYFDESKLLVRREIETKHPNAPKPKTPKCYLIYYSILLIIFVFLLFFSFPQNNCHFRIPMQHLLSYLFLIWIALLTICANPNSSYFGALLLHFVWKRFALLFFVHVIIAITHKTMIQLLLSMPFWLVSKQGLNVGYCVTHTLNYWFSKRYWMPYKFPMFCGFISNVSSFYIFKLSSMECTYCYGSPP